MPKNIVIFGDGTGNDRTSDAFKTNVARLAARTRHDGTMPQTQIVHYEAGVGREFGDLIGKATGSGISQNIQSCYDFIVWCHDPGDTIFLFGFSRGAYTVRSLAGMLAICGVPRRHQEIDGRTVDLHDEHEKKARAKLVKEAYRIYKLQDRDQRRAEGDAFANTYAVDEHKVRENRAVYFIGVWDTVRSLGIPLGGWDIELAPWPHRFHDHDLGPHVRYAYHALAIDEDRRAFYPTIWNEPTEAERLARESGMPSRQTFEQVWFPGVHSDIGGGYADARLADATLAWMIRRAARADRPLLFAPPFDADPTQGLSTAPHEGAVHDPRDSFWRRMIYAGVQQRDVIRGEQKPGERTIAKNGEADVSRTWLDRFAQRFRSYDPAPMRQHPDCEKAARQIEAGQGAVGPWDHVRE